MTASDAYMRDYTVHVPPDCVASLEDVDTRQALRYMQRVLNADTTPSAELDLDALVAEASEAAA
jgi:isochorismate hydrolase